MWKTKKPPVGGPEQKVNYFRILFDIRSIAEPTKNKAAGSGTDAGAFWLISEVVVN